MKQKMRRKYTCIIRTISFISMLFCVITSAAGCLQDVLSVDSRIFGEADTNNKSTLKKVVQKTSGPGDIDIYYYNENGERVAYEDGVVIEGDKVEYTGQAVIKLNIENIDDHKIDSSKAIVELVEGDGYYIDELILKATTLKGKWQNGELTYTLKTGDLEWNPGNYNYIDDNSGREWSCFGGDGNGCYTFRFQVSKIKYDGEPIPPATFEVMVYIWGREAKDVASRSDSIPEIEAVESSSGFQPGNRIEYVFSGDNDIPTLYDNNPDDFFIVWPTGTDASSIDSGDIKVTLIGAYDELLLRDGIDYTVFAGASETQVAVTYRHWAATPVYTDIMIEVNSRGKLKTSMTWYIASVSIYMTQQGGGGVANDGVATVYSFYGIEPIKDSSVVTMPYYWLTADIEGETFYYAEDDSGAGMLVEDQANAKTYDASGPDEMDVALLGSNSIIYKTRAGDKLLLTKTVDGEDITFTKAYQRPEIDMNSAVESGAVILLPGYGIDPERRVGFWAWLERFGYGWMGENYTGAPTSFPYPDPVYY